MGVRWGWEREEEDKRKVVPQRLGQAGSSLEAGFLWKNTALLSLLDHWDSVEGPCPEHPEPGTHTHSIYTNINEHTHKKSPALRVGRLAVRVYFLARLLRITAGEKGWRRRGRWMEEEKKQMIQRRRSLN